MAKEMIIGQPIKRGEDIFIREKDEDGKDTDVIIGKKNTHVEFRDQSPVEVAKLEKIHADHMATRHISARVAEYPDYGEFADMMYQSMTPRYDSLLPAEKAWYDKCLAVKTKHPKS